MGRTIAEKIFAAHAGRDVTAGEIVVASPDFLMAQDGTAPLAIRSFREMGGKSPRFPERVVFCIDHNAPSPSMAVSELHAMMRSFASENGIRLFDIGEGVCHQLMMEKGYAYPGGMVIGADSHTCTYGALNCFATGVGSTDLAAAMLTGELWFMVPETVRIEFRGTLGEGVYAKDLALYMVGRLGADGANYRALEISGEAVSRMEVGERMTISNMAVEVGAKAGLMRADGKTLAYIKGRVAKEVSPVEPDSDALYVDILEIDAGAVEPQLACPHQVDNVHPVSALAGMRIDQGLLGTCTNGRIEDLQAAARILKGRQVSNGTRLIVAPASREVLIQAMKEGLLEIFVEAGACIVPPGCASCVGTHQGIPGKGENVISSANRNFKGRMGNPDASIYLASPATVAASCVEGRIADPRKYLVH